MKEKVIIALDVSSRNEAVGLVRELHDLCGMFKVGSQLFTATGPGIVSEIVDAGGRVFLDMKYHDIPNTVTLAAVEAAKAGVTMLTVHASGGRAMMESVANRLGQDFPETRPWIIAVTVLTSLDTPALFDIGVEQPVEQHVRRLAILAQQCGMDGVVCSPRELSLVRRSVRGDFKLVAPGIRLPDQSLNDQQRIATPVEAISAGADYIVIGRAVTHEPDPRAALDQVLATMQPA